LLGAVQLASDAVFGHAYVPPAVGEAVYAAIARADGAPFAYDMLARLELRRGDLQDARSQALRLPDSAQREELLGRIAQAGGDDAAATQHFLRARDVEAIQTAADQLQRTDPKLAQRLESALIGELERTGTHPDETAEAYFRLGVIEAAQGRRAPAARDYVRAVELSPLSQKYLLSAGYAQLELGKAAAAARYFARVLAFNPASADGWAGAGMAALARGDRAAAKTDAAHARAVDPRDHALKTLQSQLDVRGDNVR
jgi:tetratricopeptide (TPR) repeat protein